MTSANLIPARQLRAHADDLPISRARRPDTTRELAQRDFILTVGQHLFARFGRACLTLGNVAAGLRMSPTTFRRHFCDLDDLLAEILRRHLRALTQAIGNIPGDQPDRRKAQRAAYLAATRCGLGGHTEAHRILLRDRHALPADLADQIDTLHFGLGEILAGQHAAAALALLDTAYLSAPQIEPMLEALAAADAQEDAERASPLSASAPRPAETNPLKPTPRKPPRERPKNLPEHVPEWLLAYTSFEEARAGP